MKIQTIRPWFDKEAGIVRSVGTIQEVSPIRYETIVETLKKHKDVEWIRIVEEYPDLSDMTVKEIKDELDKNKISYDHNAKKADLYALLTK